MVVLKVVHVLVAAAWFGHKLLVPLELRDAARARPDAGFVTRIERAQTLGIATGLGTLGTGLGLYLWIGPAHVRDAIHAGLAVAILMFVVGAVIARPAWGGVKRGIENADTASIRSGTKRLSIALSLESSLWVIVLATMLA